MTNALLWFVGLFLIVLQSTLLPTFLPALWVPDFLYVFVAFCACRLGWVAGMLLVFSISWMTDVVQAVDLGFYPLECIAIFTFFKVLTLNTPPPRVLYQLPLVGIGYVAWQLVTYVVYTFFNFSHPPHLFGKELFFETCIVVVTALPCLTLFSRLTNWAEQKKKWINPPNRRLRKRRK